MKKDDKDKLKSLFQEMKLDHPSVSFESRLMQRIELVSEKKAYKKQFKKNIYAAVAIAGGIIGMLSLPLAGFKLLGWSVDINLLFTKLSTSVSYIKFDPLIISVSAVVLLLLMSDTLIRKGISHKKHKE